MAERRIEAAKLCGADAVIDPTREDPEKRALEITGRRRASIWSWNARASRRSVLMAGKLTRTRGRLVIMGVFEKPAAIDLTDVVFREKTISGSMSGYGLYDETIRMMTDPRFRGDLLITDRIGLDDLIGKRLLRPAEREGQAREDAGAAGIESLENSRKCSSIRSRIKRATQQLLGFLKRLYGQSTGNRGESF